MPLLITAMLFEKYGARITVQELAEILKIAPKTVQNRLSSGKLNIKMFNDSGRFFKTEDVAIYLDNFS